MNYLIRLSALFAFAMFGMPSCLLMAQDTPPKWDKKIQLDEEKIEQWAEKHAGEWEKWAEKFESKMERWAESQESQWEDWAEAYSKRWEDWGAKLESGEFKPEEMQALLERNLEMLKDMPLASLIDGALKEGLGELKNAPFNSLAELHELIGGSLEQSLQAMEEELAAVSGSEIKGALKNLKTEDLHEAIKKLQHAIEIKQNKGDVAAAETIARLEGVLKKTDNLQSKEKAEILEVLRREMADARALQAKRAEEMTEDRQKMSKQQFAEAMQQKAMAMAAAARAKEMAALAERMVQEKRNLELGKLKTLSAKIDAEKANELARAAEEIALKKQAMDDELRIQKSSLERYYADLKKQKAELETKESAIAAMKREIQELRQEVERMKKKADKKKN